MKLLLGHISILICTMHDLLAEACNATSLVNANSEETTNRGPEGDRHSHVKDSTVAKRTQISVKIPLT